MTEYRQSLIAWLRDAHAMENQAINILDSQAKRLEHYPDLREKARTHMEQSRRQAERIEGCLERLGESTSSIKTGMGKLMGQFQGLSGLFVSDEVMKGSIASYTFEHFEIACYRILIRTAELAGEPEIARVCEDILREEQEMADWLAQHLPKLTEQFLAREASGETAKH